MKMKLMLLGIFVSAAVVVGAQSAAANTWGITFAAPMNAGTRIGAIVHLNPHLALRSSLSVDYRFYQYTDSLNKTTISSFGTANERLTTPVVAIGLGLDYYFRPQDRVSLFVGGGVGFGFRTFREASGRDTINPQADAARRFSFGVDSRIGGRFMVSERFGLYASARLTLGFVTVGNERQNERTKTITSKRSTTLLHLNTVVTPVGVVFYF